MGAALKIKAYGSTMAAIAPSLIHSASPRGRGFTGAGSTLKAQPVEAIALIAVQAAQSAAHWARAH